MKITLIKRITRSAAGALVAAGIAGSGALVLADPARADSLPPTAAPAAPAVPAPVAPAAPAAPAPAAAPAAPAAAPAAPAA